MVIFCLVMAFAVGACGGRQGAAEPVVLDAPSHPVVAPERELGAVVDPSASVPREYLRASLDALAAGVRLLPRPLPASGAARAQPALALSIRAIGSDSYGPDGLLLAGRVPAVPGIEAIAASKDGDFTQSAIDTSRQRRVAVAAHRRAGRAARSLAGRISRLDPPVAGCSDVAGGISAATESFVGKDRRLIVLSDLEQHCRANRAGSLDGVRILLVHYCTHARKCVRQERAWRRRLQGARSIEFVRFELAAEAVRRYVVGGP